MHFGKCPYCKEIIAQIKIEKIKVFQSSREVVSFVCPGCILAFAIEQTHTSNSPQTHSGQ